MNAGKYGCHLMIVASAATGMLQLSQHAHGQGSYPDRAIRLVVPFAPGGATDILARRYGAKISPLLGQQVIIDNRAAGAGGTNGTAEVARAKPDGYTLVLGTTSTHAIGWLSMKNPPFDPVKDFAPIDVIGVIPIAIAVHPIVATSLKELIQHVKAKPGQYSFASSGVNSINHFSGELFKIQAGGLNMLHVPFRGSSPGVLAVVGGEVPITFSAFSAVGPYHASRRLRVLAVFSEKRISSAPDIPTAMESGMPKMVSYTLNPLFAPAGTPKNVINVLHQANQKAMADKTFLQELERLGVNPVTDSTPEKAAQVVKDELAKWGPIVKATDMKSK